MAATANYYKSHGSKSSMLAVNKAKYGGSFLSCLSLIAKNGRFVQSRNCMAYTVKTAGMSKYLTRCTNMWLCLLCTLENTLVIDQPFAFKLLSRVIDHFFGVMKVKS